MDGKAGRVIRPYCGISGAADGDANVTNSGADIAAFFVKDTIRVYVGAGIAVTDDSEGASTIYDFNPVTRSS